MPVPGRETFAPGDREETPVFWKLLCSKKGAHPSVCASKWTVQDSNL